MNQVKQAESPVLTAGYFSKLFSWWVFGIVRLGNVRDLEQEDIYSVLPTDSTSYLGSLLGDAWESESQLKTGPNLARALLRAFGKRMICLTLQVIVIDSLRLSQSVILLYVMQSLDGAYPRYVVCFWSTIILLLNFIYISYRQRIMTASQILGMNVRVAVGNRLYRKALKLSPLSLSTSDVGQTVNFLSNDVNRYERVLVSLPALFSSPLQFGLAVGILWFYVGAVGLAGFGILLLVTPLQFVAGRILGKMSATVVKKTDSRLKMMVELVSAISLVKVCGWEELFLERIEGARRLEMKGIRKKAMLQALNFTVFVTAARVVVLLPLIAAVTTGSDISAETVFLVLSVYTSIWGLITRQVPAAISGLSEILVSAKRVQKFLCLEEKLTTTRGWNEGVVLKDVSVRWSERSVLEGIDLICTPGQLVGITGQVGTGKSSLLRAILGEVPWSNGRIEVGGKVAYAPQDPWLFSGTVRDNITFGNSFEPDWFEQVVVACALQDELKRFPFGNQTWVGDRGVTLSGGQKARISIARAIYSKADVYLLDDPLSSVDNQVGRHLVEKCIRGLLKDKCVILVTHQIRYLEFADDILVLRHENTPLHISYEDLSGISGEVTSTIVDELFEEETSAVELTGSTETRCLSKGSYGTFPLAEQPEKELRSIGKIRWAIWARYALAGNSLFTVILFGIFCSVMYFLLNYSSYFLKIWTEEVLNYNSEKSTSMNYNFLYIYAGIVAGIFGVGCVQAQLLVKICTSSSLQIHRAALDSLIRAPLQFFDSNSLGRVLNRFSSDIGIVDESIPSCVYYVIMYAATFIGAICVIGIALQVLWFILPATLLIVVFILIGGVYMKPSASIKRLEGIARTPVFAQLSTTIQGLSVIRAFGAEKTFQSRFLVAQDIHTSTYRMSLEVAQWCGVCVSWVGTSLFAVSLFILNYMSKDSSTAGLVISTLIYYTYIIMDGVIQFTELMHMGVSVERVLELSRITPEGNFQVWGNKPPRTDWPQRGLLLLDNVSVRYGSGPAVLSGLSCRINPSEKIGVVGRTGAGKSSLISAIFRLVETSAGSVHLDGINLAGLGLHEFRPKMTFIPQNPILFTGTLRTNLDPLKKYVDNELWQSLESVGLSSRFKLCDGLDTKVEESGGNFSQGEKQLICLARSLLSKNKLIILDEATANVDSETDELIQKTIRQVFKDCTVIIIAHRLDTVMDLDRICVLEAGQILEFDTPLALLDQGKGWLHDCVQKTGLAAAARLRSLAQQNTSVRSRF